MSHSFLIVVLLGVAVGCLVTLTAIAALTARDVRRTLHRVNAILIHANASARRLDIVVHRASDLADHVLQQVETVARGASTWVGARFGNGARRSRRT